MTKSQIKVLCDNCSSPLIRYKRELKIKMTFFCTRKCNGQYLSRKPNKLRKHGGYMWVYPPDHPHCSSQKKMKGFIKRSRDVVEGVLKRTLTRDEYVHHIDENPLNDIVGNLLVCDGSFHRWLHCQLEKKKYGTTARWRHHNG